jgi:hypothetical protein
VQSVRFPSDRGIEEGFGRIVDVKQIPARLAAPDLEGLPPRSPVVARCVVWTSGREAIYMWLPYAVKQQRYRLKKYSSKDEPGLFVGRAVVQIGGFAYSLLSNVGKSAGQTCITLFQEKRRASLYQPGCPRA